MIAIFDIGKTNKKLLLFDESLKLVLQEEQKFPETRDEDGFECDDIRLLETWMKQSIEKLINKGEFKIKALNFSTYGASLMHLDGNGKPLTPVYNYLKPMPDDVLNGFYEKYDGVEEFSRKTASPALGMLNSGLQILWIKKKRPDIFRRIHCSLHFPQYVSYLFTGKTSSEYTSIGCHTAMWDFDSNQYHRWLADEGIRVPDPLANDTFYPVEFNTCRSSTGIGIHDSSSSLVPYLKAINEPFILISTGTWCIFMNPFNQKPLTGEQLRKDSLCYMSIHQKQVKSSRLFLGHIHDVNVERLNKHFGTHENFYKSVKTSELKVSRLLNKKERYFFHKGVPADYIDIAPLTGFLTFDDAYHQLMADLVDLAMESLHLVIPSDDQPKKVFITGGFARNELFTRLVAGRLPGKKVFTSEVDNATALGAAIIMYKAAFDKELPEIDLGLKEIVC
ncbi:MAG TPA: FGGY family carbohydrate kinase [Bacteroidales bacterium]|nr:FGGY family carbohydrate kinase [Bacteroidales bacterium]